MNSWYYDQDEKVLHVEAEAGNGYTITLDGTVSTNPKNGKLHVDLTGSIKDDTVARAHMNLYD